MSRLFLYFFFIYSLTYEYTCSYVNIFRILLIIVMGCNSGGVKGGERALGGEGRGVGSLSEVLLEVGRSAENV